MAYVGVTGVWWLYLFSVLAASWCEKTITRTDVSIQSDLERPEYIEDSNHRDNAFNLCNTRIEGCNSILSIYIYNLIWHPLNYFQELNYISLIFRFGILSTRCLWVKEVMTHIGDIWCVYIYYLYYISYIYSSIIYPTVYLSIAL